MLPVPDPTLCDGVVSLRPREERDLPAIERGINDPDVIRAFGRPTLAAKQLLELNHNRWNQDEAATFAICDPGDRCLGHVFVNPARAGRGNIGYSLLPEARGKGLATRAVLLVARWALRGARARAPRAPGRSVERALATRSPNTAASSERACSAPTPRSMGGASITCRSRSFQLTSACGTGHRGISILSWRSQRGQSPEFGSTKSFPTNTRPGYELSGAPVQKTVMHRSAQTRNASGTQKWENPANRGVFL